MLSISPFYEFQIEIIKALQSWGNDVITFFFELITMIGEEYIAIVILAALYFMFDKKMAQKILFSVAFSQVLNGTVKNIVKEPRPHQMSPDIVDVRHAESYSFPSGHSQMAATWLNAVAIEVDKKKKVKWPYIVANVLVLLVMLSRMYLGQHFLIDVVVGGLLGVVVAFGMSKLYDYYDKKEKLRSLYQVSCIIFIPALVYFLIVSGDLGDNAYFFFKMYGLLLGVSFAYGFEKKYVNFTYNVSLWKKILRLVLAVVVLLAIKEGLGAVFTLIAKACLESGSWGHAVYCVLHFIRYGLLAFITMGVYPLLFKKFNF